MLQASARSVLRRYLLNLLYAFFLGAFFVKWTVRGMVEVLLISAILALVLMPITAQWSRRASQRGRTSRAAGGSAEKARPLRVECGLRAAKNSGVRGLSSRWRHGRAEISVGRVRFSPYLPPGIRIRFGRTITLIVVEIGEVRNTRTREWLNAAPGSSWVELQTTDGVVDLLLPPGLDLMEFASVVVSRENDCPETEDG